MASPRTVSESHSRFFELAGRLGDEREAIRQSAQAALSRWPADEIAEALRVHWPGEERRRRRRARLFSWCFGLALVGGGGLAAATAVVFRDEGLWRVWHSYLGYAQVLSQGLFLPVILLGSGARPGARQHGMARMLAQAADPSLAPLLIDALHLPDIGLRPLTDRYRRCLAEWLPRYVEQDVSPLDPVQRRVLVDDLGRAAKRLLRPGAILEDDEAGYLGAVLTYLARDPAARNDPRLLAALERLIGFLPAGASGNARALQEAARPCLDAVALVLGGGGCKWAGVFPKIHL